LSIFDFRAVFFNHFVGHGGIISAVADSYKLMNILSHLFLSRLFRATMLAGAILTFSAFTTQNVIAQETPPAKCEKCTADKKCDKCADKKKCSKCTADSKCDKCSKKSKCAKCAKKSKCAAKADKSKCKADSKCAKKANCEKCTADQKCDKCADKKKCSKCTADSKCDKCAKKGNCAKSSEGKKCGKCAKKADSNKSVSLTGEIIEINADRDALLVKHDAIEGVMPAMTMEFRTDSSTLATLEAGQKITAQLKGDWLSDIAVQ
jgi:Cu/Ag efflux protein CusF